LQPRDRDILAATRDRGARWSPRLDHPDHQLRTRLAGCRTSEAPPLTVLGSVLIWVIVGFSG
jgi:hypothetical protein